MARQEKSTRARGLPPRVLLSQRQDATGSFPTVWRTSSDNRTGRYNISFNDNKVVPFNQYEAADYDSNFLIKAASDVAAGVQYVEKVEDVGFVAAGGSRTVYFSPPFPFNPIVVITEISSSNNSHNVNAFLIDITTSNFTVKFSSQFTGSIVYRAAYDPSQGTFRIVERKPRYPNAFTRFVAQTETLTDTNTTDITFNDFGDDTAENFITFYDKFANGQADIWPNITTQTRTLVALTASSIATANVEYERFHGLHNRGIIYPLGMNQATILAGLSQENQIEMYGSVSFISGAVVNQPTKWIVASGSMKKNVADTFVTFTPGQDIQAFRDSDNPAIDGKKTTNSFYATGSAVEVAGQGFQQPLWSKSKVEIDLTPSQTHTISSPTTGSIGESFPMMYWNPSKGKYEGIGSGKPRAEQGGSTSYTNDLFGLKAFLEEQTIGFSSCVDGGGIPNNNRIYDVYGRQISNFGFPYAKKFQPTNSQQINISEYISEPFLLEKIVLQVSAALDLSGSNTSKAAMWTFCVMNSRNMLPEKIIGEQLVSYYIGGVKQPSFVTSSNAGSSYLDLIDYCQISFTGSFIAGGRELSVLPTIYGTPTQGARHISQMTVSSSVKNSIKYDGSTANFFTGSSDIRFVQSLNFSSRNQTNEANGREWKNSAEIPISIGSDTFDGVLTNINDVYTKINPYLLLPSDKLTFAWHLPWASNVTKFQNSSITFSPSGINKITLYGSSLRVNPETNQLEEHHDTLNQLLSSNSIHEIITG